MFISKFPKRKNKKRGRERGEGVRAFFDEDKKAGDERRCRRWSEKDVANLGCLDF